MGGYYFTRVREIDSEIDREAETERQRNRETGEQKVFVGHCIN